MSITTQTIIQQTKNWVSEVVIGLNLCPFAASVFAAEQIAYIVAHGDNKEQHLLQLVDCFTQLDSNDAIETSLVIYPDTYLAFDDYLDFLHLTNQLLKDLNYTGIYQIASFHPDYRFDGSHADDAANYTNRSPYPMLHLIRESSLEKALANYPDIEQVPENNIKNLRDIGYKTMQAKLKKLTE